MKSEKNDIESKIVEIFSHDLTEEIAENFLGQLFTAINNNGNNLYYSGEKCYQDVISKTYGPMIKSFAEKIYSTCKEIDAVPLCLARDATPIHYILNHIGANPKLGYFTRAVMGHNDEINENIKEKEVNKKLLTEYFLQVTEGKDVIVVDAGMYGSLVHDLQEIGDGKVKGVMYLFSKNPSIYGYLNDIWEINSDKLADKQITDLECGQYLQQGHDLDLDVMKYITANIIIDSLECAHPHPTKSPHQLLDVNGKIIPKFEKQSVGQAQEVIEYWWKTVVESYINCNGNPIPSLGEIYTKIKSKSFTGLIPLPTPEWSKKKEFLSSFKKSVGPIYPIIKSGELND
jgi:hypothetical protein